MLAGCKAARLPSGSSARSGAPAHIRDKERGDAVSFSAMKGPVPARMPETPVPTASFRTSNGSDLTIS